MKLVIREIHASASASTLNDEWFIVENAGDRAFSTAGVSVGVGRGQGQKGRLRSLGTLDPGFTLQPNERMRVITGNPAKKAHGGVPPETETKNYHLFLAERLLQGPGTVLGLSLHQHEITRATYDPKGAGGIQDTGE